MKLVYSKTVNFELTYIKENFYILYRVDSTNVPLIENTDFEVIEQSQVPVATVSNHFNEAANKTMFCCSSIGLFTNDISTTHSDLEEVTKQWIAKYVYHINDAGKSEVKLI